MWTGTKVLNMWTDSDNTSCKGVKSSIIYMCSMIYVWIKFKVWKEIAVLECSA